MKQPSSWLPNGIILNPSDQYCPFSFTEDLQIRLEELLEKNDELLTIPCLKAINFVPHDYGNCCIIVLSVSTNAA